MSQQESITLKAAADAYLEHLAKSNTKPSTITVYKKVLDLAISHFGEDRKLDSILLPQVGKFYNSESVNVLPNGKPKAEATIKQIKRVFRQCLEFAQQLGFLATLPIPRSEMEHARQKGIQLEPVSIESTEVSQVETFIDNSQDTLETVDSLQN